MDSFNTATLGPHGGSTGYLCRYYWWQNEAHQFPAASAMTSGIGGPPTMAFGLQSHKYFPSKNPKECLNSPYFICH